jgi:hypothetical protein
MNVGVVPDTPFGAANGPDICGLTGTHPVAYHYWGLNTPDFAVLPTARGCAPNFAAFTWYFSHEAVELLSEPAQVAHGAWGGTELGDRCQNFSIGWKG